MRMICAVVLLLAGAGCTPFGYYSAVSTVVGEALSPTVTESAETPDESEPNG